MKVVHENRKVKAKAEEKNIKFNIRLTIFIKSISLLSFGGLFLVICLMICY